MLRVLAWFLAAAPLLNAVQAAAPRPQDALKTPADTRQLAEFAMQLIAGDKVDAAFERLKPYWPLPANEVDSVVLKTIAARNTVSDRFGKTTGYALVREEKIADFLIRYTYAEKREKHILRWIFYFYRPADVWIVNSVTWDDNIQGLF